MKPTHAAATIHLRFPALRILALFVILPRALAQLTLTNGASQAGSLSAGSTNTYHLAASPGDTITLRIGAVFRPRLTLVDPSGTALATSIGAGVNTRDVLIANRASTGGEFSVEVSGVTPEVAGTYSLNLAKTPGSFTISPGDQGGALTNGAVHPATLSLGDLDPWSFSGKAGDSIVLRVGGAFRPLVELYGPDGVLVGSSNGGGVNDRDTVFAARLNQTGAYSVLTHAAQANGIGDYSLHFVQAPGDLAVSPGDEGGALTNGAATPANLTLGDLDAWRFTAHAGDTVELRAGGAFRPRIDLFAPDGSVVATGIGGGINDRDASVLASLTADGDYTAVVQGVYANSTGPYTLHLVRVPGDYVVSSGDEGGALLNGVPASGALTLGDLDSWHFEAQALDSVELRVGATFRPRIDLYGPDGALVESDIGGGINDRDASVGARLKSGGRYTAVIQGVYNNAAGTYALHLAQTPGDITTAPGDEGGSLINGTAAPGVIQLGDLDPWQFDAAAGDVLALRMGATFRPRFDLFAPDGALLGSSLGGGVNDRDTLLNLVAPATGRYTVVSQSTYNNGTGTYTLHLGKVPGAFTVGAGDEGGSLSLSSNSPNRGVLTLGDIDLWSFTAQPGENVWLRIAATGFTPRIQVYDADGTKLGDSTATGLSIRTAHSGPHTLLVTGSRLNEEGTYLLRYAKVPESYTLPADAPGGLANWSVQGGLWELGKPAKPNGPVSSHSGNSCAATLLADDYPDGVDARLSSPAYTVPASVLQPRFRYWQWHATASAADFGQLQIRTNGSAWLDVAGERVSRAGGEWIQRIVDLRPCAGQQVQLGFRFVSDGASTGPGWFIDDIAFETGPTAFANPEGFDNSFADWSSEAGLWQVGRPTAVNGPAAPHSGTACAGTLLATNFPVPVDARFTSPRFLVPDTGYNPYLAFWHWLTAPGALQSGRVQISTNGTTWKDLGNPYTGSSGGWSRQQVDLSSYAGLTVQVGFRFVATAGTPAPGWFIDEVEFGSVAPAGLPLGGNVTNRFSSAGQRAYYALQVPPGRHLRLQLDDLDNLGSNEIYLRRGSIPTPSAFDHRVNQASADSSIFVPDAAAGTWYVLVVASAVPAPGDVVLHAEADQGVVLRSLSPQRIGNLRTELIDLNGAGFSEAARVQLLSGGTLVRTGAVSLISSQRLFARVDFAGLPGGTYLVQVAQGDQLSGTLPLEVIGGGLPRLETQFIVPRQVGRHAPATIIVEYANTGDASMPAPLLLVHGSDKALLTLDPTLGARGLWAVSKPRGFSDTIPFLASGATPGLLQPGERQRKIIYYAGLLRPWTFADTSVRFDLAVFDSENAETIDWNALREAIRPEILPAAGWDAVFDNFRTAIGTHWGDFVSKLSENARQLATVDSPDITVAELITFELEQADGLNPIRVLESATDARVRQPGIDLTFQRVFPNSLAFRHRAGPLGYGWFHNWEYELHVNADGDVTVHGPGGTRRDFQRDIRRGYFRQPGDFARLTDKGAGRYTLMEPDGRTLGFRADGRIEFLEDMNGNRITAEYSAGRLATLRHSAGQWISFNYEGTRLTRITDSLGHTVEYSMDAAGNLASVTRDGFLTNRFATQPGTSPAVQHALAGIQYPDGSRCEFQYTPQGQLLTASNGDSVDAVRFEYDAAGGLAATKPTGHRTRVQFERHGRMAVIDAGDGRTTRFSYDRNLNPVSIRGPGGRLTSLAYDPAGNLTRVLDPAGSTLQLEYAANGRVARFTDARGQSTRFQYDIHGNTLSLTYPDGSREGREYDAQGGMTALTNRRAQRTTLERDASGRLVRKTLPDGRLLGFQYDARGNLAGTTDSLLGATLIERDERDRITRIEYPGGRGLRYAYDPPGRLVESVTHDGYRLRYERDARGRILSVRDGDNLLVARYEYDASGHTRRQTRGNGTITTYDFDNEGRITRLTHLDASETNLGRFDFAYDPTGAQSSVASTAGTTRFEYDPLGQLSRVEYPGGRTVAYAYDPVGNRTAVNDNGSETTYAIDPLNQYSRAGTATFGYDADGNLTRRTDASGVTELNYDAENRLIQVKSPVDGTWEFTYDAFGSRVAATHNGQIQHWLVDPMGRGNVVAEYDAANHLTGRWDHGLDLARWSDASGRQFWNHGDALGSVRLVSDATGRVVNRYDYDAFGTVVTAEEAVPNRHRFVGGLGVSESVAGLLFMRERYYDPALGRFLSPDPLWPRLLQQNLLAYAANDPVQFVDPEGLARVCSRPLDGKDSMGRSDWRNEQNLETLHQQILFDTPKFDTENRLGWGPKFRWDNIGFFGQNLNGVLFKEGDGFVSPENRNNYSDCTTYDDDLLWQAVLHTGTWAHYNITGENCQDWIDAVLNNYSRLANSSKSGTAASHDPNELIGPAGYGPANHLLPNAPFTYEIHFENATNATAPAQVVVISNPLDPSLDLNSLELLGAGFGDVTLHIPAGSQRLEQSVRITQNGIDFDVLVEVHLDHLGRQLIATFESSMPGSGLPPTVDVGFLPPEDGSGRGQGFVSYLMRPIANLNTGVEIRNIATVTFDPLAGGPTFRTDLLDPANPLSGIDPNRQALVTIDRDAPTSLVTPLPVTTESPGFIVAWSGADSGAGIESFDIYVRIDGGAWQPWLLRTSETSARWEGQPGHTYGFKSVAHDGAGNAPAAPTSNQLPDSEIKVTGATSGEFQSIEGLADGSVSLPFAGAAGSIWRLDRARTPAGPWEPVVTLPVGANGTVVFVDPQPLPTGSFYRAVRTPE